MRMLALAQHWKSAGHEALLCSYRLPIALRAKWHLVADDIHDLESSPYGQSDAEETSWWSRDRRANGIVVDGYRFSPPFYKCFQATGTPVVVVDDGNRSNCPACDLLVDQRVQAKLEDYPQLSPNQMLLGTDYAMLRAEFLRHAKTRLEGKSKRDGLLVLLGGSDVKRQTPKLLECLSKKRLPVPHGGIHLVVGPLSAWEKEDLPTHVAGVKLELHTNPDDIAEVMGLCGFGISAAGTTLQELNFMGVATVILVAAENQEEGATIAAKECRAVLAVDEDEAVRLVRNLMNSDSLAESLRMHGMRRYDGLGTSRIAHAIERLLIVSC
jgi:spore coat polysaccharide biosynthesis predicted glycosyltransferase SpsG